MPLEVAENKVGKSIALARYVRVKLQLIPNLIVITSRGIKPAYLSPIVKISKPPTVAMM